MLQSRPAPHRVRCVALAVVAPRAPPKTSPRAKPRGPVPFTLSLPGRGLGVCRIPRLHLQPQRTLLRLGGADVPSERTPPSGACTATFHLRGATSAPHSHRADATRLLRTTSRLQERHVTKYLVRSCQPRVATSTYFDGLAPISLQTSRKSLPCDGARDDLWCVMACANSCSSTSRTSSSVPRASNRALRVIPRVRG